MSFFFCAFLPIYFMSNFDYTAYNKFMENAKFWEFELKADVSHIKSVEYIKSKLKPLVKAQKGVMTTIYNGSDILLIIGVLEAQKMEILPKLYLLITEVLTSTLKAEYIKNHFNFNIKQDLLFKCFLKGLTCFDSDFEKEIVYSKLLNNNKIVLESFFDFKLKFLKSKWQDLISLANDNYLYLLSGGNFFELMKFLLSNLDCKQDEVEVSFLGKEFLLSSKGKALELPMLTDNKNQEDLVTTLVSLCPKKITIFDKENLTTNIESFLCELFENRLKIVK